ncbi:MAG TPA: transglycosylase SLT domain-containing protein [Myxococcota bacterium]|nr:transglycosylase SLT domain-containing protein [Myxococcota bacterium]HQK51835.1 transglycosylase SLT domain-containing protein [Myxococcota bacterium]
MTRPFQQARWLWVPWVVLGAGTALAQGPATFPEVREEAVARVRTADPAGALALVEAAATPVDPREQAQALWIRARALNDLGRREEARALLRDLAPGLPGHLREVLEEQRARAAEGAPDGPERIRAFLAAHPRSPLATDLRLALARGLLARGDREGARREAEEVIRSRPHRPLRGEALRIQAMAMEARERAAVLRGLFLDLPETPAAAATGLRESDLSPGELERRARGFDAALEYREAQRIREDLWRQGRGSPGLAMVLARSHLVLVRDDPARALELLRVAEAGGVLRGPDRHLWFARALARLERYDEAVAHYRAYRKEGGRKDRARALYYLGWLPYDHGRYEEALPQFDRFLREARRSPDRSYVAWFKAWSLYRLRRYPEALQALQAMIPMGNNLVAGKALYWMGRIHHLLGQDREAREALRRLVDRYPLSYYAVLAAQRRQEWWGEPLPEWVTGPSPGLPDPGPFWGEGRLPKALVEAMRRVRDLSDLGEVARARREWAPVARAVLRHVQGADRLRLLSTVLGALELDHDLYQAARREAGGRLGPVPTRDGAAAWKALYPRARRPLVVSLARRFAFPEVWAYAIMRQESRYDDRQVSHTAALGIMQMIPSTARRISALLGVPFDVQGFFDSGRNLLFCTRYLAMLLPEFRNQVLFASAAYNSGAPAIRRFLRDRQGLPFDEMVESIAYNEGRNYARKVAEHLVRYAYLYLSPEERVPLYEALFPREVDYGIGTDVDF